MADTDIKFCQRDGCDGRFLWARTARQYDRIRRKWKGGNPMPINWPLPQDIRARDGVTVVAAAGRPVPNVGLTRDAHGTWWARVATVGEPIRTDERPAYAHHVFCKNPPKPDRRPVKEPATDQGALELGPLSDARLFPPPRRG